MHANKLKKIKVSGRLTYINYDSVQQFDQVKIKMGGHSSREWSKVPYRVKIPVDTAPQGLYRRWDLKLRPGATDPTMLREKVYDDLLQAVGVTAAKGTYVRFYINDTPVGLYLLADDSASDSFIRETFHQGNPNVALGEFVQGDAGKGDYAANLGFLGETEEAYDDKVYDVKIDGPDDQSDAMASLISFMKFIRDYNPQTVPDSEKVLELWEPWIDMISYLRQAAIEWIGGNWDGIQYSGNNYALYRVPSTEQYMAIPMDFDFTFGNGLEEDQQHLLTGKWSQFTQDRIIHSYLWENIRQTPYLVRLYESILADVNQNVSNPQKMNDRIDALAYMIQHDVNWDRSLPRLTVGKTRSASRNFLDSLEQGTDDLDERIGLKEWVREKYAAINRDVGAQGSEDDTQEADTLPEKEDA
ncbi:spore coat protein coth [Phycomyces blakesleeanus]